MESISKITKVTDEVKLRNIIKEMDANEDGKIDMGEVIKVSFVLFLFLFYSVFLFPVLGSSQFGCQEEKGVLASWAGANLLGYLLIIINVWI